MNRRELFDRLLLIAVIAAVFLGGAVVAGVFTSAPLETILIEVTVG